MNRVFIDPTGNHIVIVTVSGDLYYLHSSKSKAVQLKRFSGHTVESVAWNKAEGTALCTGVCFRKGRIDNVAYSHGNSQWKDSGNQH